MTYNAHKLVKIINSQIEAIYKSIDEIEYRYNVEYQNLVFAQDYFDEVFSSIVHRFIDIVEGDELERLYSVDGIQVGKQVDWIEMRLERLEHNLDFIQKQLDDDFNASESLSS